MRLAIGHTSSATPRSQGWPVETGLEITRSRVSGGDEKSFGEEELRNLGFIPDGGTPLYRHRRAAIFIQDVDGERSI
jgi:hypothetical protein